MADPCEECVHYDYDEELEAFVCQMDLDEDEMARFCPHRPAPVPFTAGAMTMPPPGGSKALEKPRHGAFRAAAFLVRISSGAGR